MRSIIVIGYARSGTSLTAGILHQLGVDMGDKRVWRKADEANEKGYFENSQFVNANISILEKGKVPNLKAIVDKNKSDIWGAKDPRFLDTWEHWEHFIENPHFIVCNRGVKSIVESVCYRDNGKHGPKKEPEDVVKDVADYYTRAWDLSDKYPSLHVYYDEYFTNNEQIQKIADFVGVPHKEIDLVDINLKHF